GPLGALKNSFRARPSSISAAKGEGAGGWPAGGGGDCMGRTYSALASSGRGGESGCGSLAMTMAPLSLPLYFAKSSLLLASKKTTGPRTVPLVPGAQPAEAMVSGCSVGAMMRAEAVPRVQEWAMVHGSRCTFTKPYVLITSAVHSLACLS